MSSKKSKSFMKRWSVTGTIVSGGYFGNVEARTPEEALEKALGLDLYVSVCHQCGDTISDPQVTEIEVYCDETGESAKEEDL